MTTETRQQRRQNARQDRNPRFEKNIFDFGLEAVEIPIEAISTEFTPTEATVYQVIILNSDRFTGRIHRAKIADYAWWIGRSEVSIHTALAGLNAKGYIQTTTNGYVEGVVLKRQQNIPKADLDAEQETLDLESTETLSRALVHRQALKIMCQHRLSGLTQRVYWEFATQIDVNTGEIHRRKIAELAERFGVSEASIYKAIRQLNAAGLTNFTVDFGVSGQMPHVALAYGVIRLAVERKKEEAKNGHSAVVLFNRYKTALYRCFGIQTDSMNPVDIKKAIADLKQPLDQYLSKDTGVMHNLSRL